MIDTKWLTAKEASQYCYENGLSRSVKSIRRWCQFDNVEAQKRQVSNKQKWFIDRESLEIKIKEELEFLKHSDNHLPQHDQLTNHKFETPAQDRTQADISAHNRTQADTSGYDRTQPDRPNQPTIRQLEDQILILETDKTWRDQVLSEQKQALKKAQGKSEAQSRYIGHLETKIMRLGERPDLTFLAAPVPKPEPSEDIENAPELINPEITQSDRTHPDQSNLYTG